MPNSGTEQRLTSKLSFVQSGIQSNDAKLTDLKETLDRFISQSSIGTLTPSQYDTFEENIISHYLEGELFILHNTLLAFKEWDSEKKAQLPTSIHSLCCLLEIVCQYCKTAQIDDALLSSYCSTPSTPRLDKLLISFLLSFGTRAQIIAVGIPSFMNG